MTGEADSQIEVNGTDGIEKFTFLELAGHPVDTAKYVIAFLPPTIDFMRALSLLNPRNQDRQKVLLAAERMAAALDYLKPVNPDKAERMQAGIREAISKTPTG